MTLGLNTAHDASGISYLASDGLGSVSEALSPSGSATGAQLYSPYGGVRYSSGTMPTAKGFTGQYSDASSTGLDYYGARYYDPALGQFTSADTVSDGLNRYGYVKGNPETATDPTGHRLSVGDAGSCGTNGSSKGYNQPSTHKPNSNKSPVWDSAADALDVQGFHIALVRRQTAINLAKARARTVEVSGYTKGNGTQVEPYTRRAPGSKAWDEELTGR